MEIEILKKKLSVFKTATGKLTQVGDEVLIEVLRCWEQWRGPSTDLGRELGVSPKQISFLIRKAERVIKEGGGVYGDFKEVAIIPEHLVESTGGSCSKIELVWGPGKIIRFSEVHYLMEFLKLAS